MSEKKKAKFIDVKRRGFMQGATVAGVATATGATSTAVHSNELEEGVLKPKGKDRYQDTDYQRAYYRNARF